MTADSLPLEIASSLRLILVGDTGIGKTTSQALFLESVPGQIHSAPMSAVVADASGEQDKQQEPAATTDDSTSSAEATENGEAQGGDNTTEQSVEATSDKQQEKQHEEDGYIQGRVSTLSIPGWLAATSPNLSSTNAVDNTLVPAENIVLYDFVGYGQHPNAQFAMDKVESHLNKQYQQTRQLFGPSLSPYATIPSTVTVVDESGASLSTDQQQEQTPATSSLLLQLLEGGAYAHTIPDACLYFILYDLKPVDIQFMKRIMHQVNLIPILAKADTLSINQLWKAKARILKQLEQHQIEFFQFGFELDELKEMAADKLAGGPPFALSVAETSSIIDGYYTSSGHDETEDGGSSLPKESLRDLAVAINSGAYANTNSDLSLLQALLLGSKNRMLHKAAAQKFVKRWQAEVGPPPASANPDNSNNGGSSKDDNNHNANSDAAAENGAGDAATGTNGHMPSSSSSGGGSTNTSTNTTTTTTTTIITNVTYQPAPPYASSPATPSATTTTASSPTTMVAAARPLSTQEEEVVAQVVKLSRATSVMRRSPSMKNLHNGMLQEGSVPSVPPVNATLLSA